MSTTTSIAARAKPVALMLVAVFLQIAGAALLKTLADARAGISLFALAFGISAVLLLNAARLVVWGVAHRRYPLSTVFPLTALFFPAMLALAAVFGDPIRVREIAGAALITAGSAWLAWRVPR